MILLDPNNLTRKYSDAESKDIMRKTVQFFENKGKVALKNDDHERVWYQDCLDFVKKNEIFYKLLTPSKYGEKGCRWDTWRNMEFNEILARIVRFNQARAKAQCRSTVRGAKSRAAAISGTDMPTK